MFGAPFLLVRRSTVGDVDCVGTAAMTVGSAIQAVVLLPSDPLADEPG